MRLNKFINVTLYVLIFLVVPNAYAGEIYSKTDLNGRYFEQGLLNETKIEADAFLHTGVCHCENGFCKNEGGELKCICNPEFGLYKENLCKECNCGKGANCTFEVGIFIDDILCICPKGYEVKGQKCIAIDPCLSHPCQNGGACRSNESEYKCTCLQGYSGDNCEKAITPCTSNPCKNGGTCKVTGKDFQCSCKAPYSGKTCETIVPNSYAREIYNKTDLNGRDFEKGFLNELKVEVDGTLHAGDCRCENGRCESGGGRSVCVCNPGYGLIDIGRCEKCNCGKDYGCIFQRIIHHSEKECLCPNNYIDIGGKCKACRCGENELCTNKGDEICICKEGFGRKDDVCTKKCDENRMMCQNGGYCMDDPNGPFCECKSGTSGDMCSVIDACEDNHFCGSGTDVICIYDMMEEKPRCACQDPMEQYDAITKMCRKTCSEDNPCANEAKCVEGPNGSLCHCKNGTSGEFCSVVDACTDDNFCGSDSDVICSYDPVKEKPYCECRDLLKQFDASEKKCKTKCDETNYPCQNGGKCIGDIENPLCYCRPGTSGDLCFVVDACERNWDLCGSGNDVKCLYDVAEEKAYCACEDSSKQYDEMTKECKSKITHPCLSHPCQHGGTCLSHEMEYTCKCTSGYSGENCENDPCSSLPCKNGGICEVNGDSYSCYCPHPFRGNNCELGPCSDNPCENEGECKTLFRSFRCICKPPFFGLRCERDACHGNPCKNGGLCKALEYGYKCFCSSPFSGFHCEKGPCSDRPCKNDGICQVEGDGYRCFCRAPYCGKSCEIENCNCGNGKCNREKKLK